MSKIIRPIEDFVVVEIHSPEKQTAGGILLPEKMGHVPRTGTVIAVGPGRLLENGQRLAMSIAAGNEIAFGAYAGADIEIDKKPLRVLREIEVYGVLEDA